jgi:hypothetical protein
MSSGGLAETCEMLRRHKTYSKDKRFEASRLAEGLLTSHFMELRMEGEGIENGREVFFIFLCFFLGQFVFHL